MRKVFLQALGLLIAAFSMAQGGGSHEIVNQLPNFIAPAPEAASLLKADQLSVNRATGSPNITIPVATLPMNSYSLPVTLQYTSTGVKVDEYASMCGMGWTLEHGGVISRTVMGRPDETRDPNNCNLNTYNFGTYNQTLLNFLRYSTDKESDIFTFSFPGGSGKFIIDLNGQPVQLTRQNFKIEVYNSSMQNGFVITTDDGTAYYFLDAEISQSRNPSGENCDKTYEVVPIKTSWYLTKIIHASTKKFINFYYNTYSNVTFESSITQTISKVIYAEQYQCTGMDLESGPTGWGCDANAAMFSTCISTQVVTAKSISKIENSDGDKVEFFYDGTLRTDLENGRRLSSVKVTNRNSLVIRSITLYSSYQNAVTSGITSYENKRLFLDKLSIKSNAAASDSILYTFTYNDYAGLPARLSYGQDFYGYYNGKNTNASLIPILLSGDACYSHYNNGTGTSGVTFGDRSIDTLYSIKGLLNKIVYPTGGYDTLLYRPNRYLASGVEKITGGNSIYKIISYSHPGAKTLEREYIYRFKSDNALSALLLTKNLLFSDVITTYKDGYACVYPGQHTNSFNIGPRCDFAVVTSNTNIPISAFGGQHVYYQSVLERTLGASGDIGLTEHRYAIFNSANLTGIHKMGNDNLNTPYQIVPDVTIGEIETNIYKNNSGTYQQLKSTKKHLRIDGLTNYSSYIVKDNYTILFNGNPLGPADFGMFDVDEYYINVYTILIDSVVEKDFDENGITFTSKTIMEYASSAYTYPTRVIITESDGIERKVERKFPPDYGGLTYMVSRNIISPLMEEKEYNNNNLVLTTVKTYSDWFSNSTVLEPQTVEQKSYSNTQGRKINFYSYDTVGNVLELARENDFRVTQIWDYGLSFPVAKIENADKDNVAYTSFEADGKGSWSFSGLPYTDGSTPSGRRVYSLAGNNITRSGLSTSTTYWVSYWSKNGAQTVNSVSATSGRTINGWQYFQHKIVNPASGLITVSGSGVIDELRLYPEASLMATFTFDPLIGVTSQCNVNNQFIYYEYDALGRLMLVKDQDRKLLRKICYNYAGQPESCTMSYNTLQTLSFSRNNCGAGYTGGSVSYSVPANTYGSSINQTLANEMALNDVLANGQAYANTYGTCTPISTCGPSNCSGANKKCVNGVCETGIKVYTNSVLIGFHLWECTYHYEWSDSSWSQNYTEESPQDCMDE